MFCCNHLETLATKFQFHFELNWFQSSPELTPSFSSFHCVQIENWTHWIELPSATKSALEAGTNVQHCHQCHPINCCDYPVWNVNRRQRRGFLSIQLDCLKRRSEPTDLTSDLFRTGFLINWAKAGSCPPIYVTWWNTWANASPTPKSTTCWKRQIAKTKAASITKVSKYFHFLFIIIFLVWVLV